jgi:hypothetical protein
MEEGKGMGVKCFKRVAPSTAYRIVRIFIAYVSVNWGYKGYKGTWGWKRFTPPCVNWNA